MSKVITAILLQPLLAGAALLALTRGPPEIHERFTTALAKLPVRVTEDHVITGLKVLLGLGILSTISGALDWLSFRNWELFYSGKPWVWDQEIAVVTGGSGGIATPMIEKLLAKGMRVAILDLNPPRADLLNHKNVKFYRCDLTSAASIREVAAKIKSELGTASVLVNNAGLAVGMPILEIADKQLETIFKVNTIAHWYTVREFLPGMIEAKKGHIVTVASMASYTGVAGIVDYSATKASALAFHEGLTQEIRHVYKAPYLRTTICHPFWTSTNMTTLIEEGIKKTDALVTADYVGGVIAKQILSGTGGHLIIPDYVPKLRAATLVRGLPSWINSYANDTTKENVLTTLNSAEGREIAKKRYM